MPLTACTTQSLGQPRSPAPLPTHSPLSHLNIYECCRAATFHYRRDCLAWGSQSFHPALVRLGALHFIQLRSVCHLVPGCHRRGRCYGGKPRREGGKKLHKGAAVAVARSQVKRNLEGQRRMEFSRLQSLNEMEVETHASLHPGRSMANF